MEVILYTIAGLVIAGSVIGAYLEGKQYNRLIEELKEIYDSLDESD